MKYVACVFALGLCLQAAPAAAQVVYEPVPEEVTEYVPSVPVTTYYAPSVPVVRYAAPLPMRSYYYSPYYYGPAAVYYPGARYYVPPRVARRWYRNGFYW